MSYPFGTWNEEVVAIARAAGIVYSRDTRTTGGFGWPQEFMHWEGTCHHHEMLERGRAFLEFNRHPLPLMYVWGHAYEFDNDDNWNEMEEFAASFFRRSPHGQKIRQHIGSALDIVPTLGYTLELVFIDGDKRE